MFKIFLSLSLLLFSLNSTALNSTKKGEETPIAALLSEAGTSNQTQKNGRLKKLRAVPIPRQAININRIKANTLSKQLGISLRDAKIVIRQRKPGGYKNMRQLRALKGLSKKTLKQLKKSQFAFGKGTKSSATPASAKPELL